MSCVYIKTVTMTKLNSFTYGLVSLFDELSCSNDFTFKCSFYYTKLKSVTVCLCRISSKERSEDYQTSEPYAPNFILQSKL